MNALTKLFGPRALATTVATSLLVGAALAQQSSYAVFAVSGQLCDPNPCPNGVTPHYPGSYTHVCCEQINNARYWWCCGYSDSCIHPMLTNANMLCETNLPDWLPCPNGDTNVVYNYVGLCSIAQ